MVEGYRDGVVVPSESKRTVREEARRVRASLDLPTLSRATADHLARWLRRRAVAGDGGLVVLTYDPLPDELDLTVLPDRLADLPIRWAITRTPDVGPLTIHDMPAADGWEPHRFGFRQPKPSCPIVPASMIDVALVPGLAFDRRGHRLGRGAGYLDELLSRLRPDALRVGVTPSATVLDELPVEDHDVTMTHLATEHGVEAVQP